MQIETTFYSAGTAVAATLGIPDAGNEAIYKDELKELPEELAILSRKYPAVILLHGGSRSRNDGLDKLAEVLAEAGIISLRFDFAGCGLSPAHPYSQRMETEMPYQVSCAIYYLESLPCVDRERIGISGISMGGAMSLRMAATDKRIKSAAAMSANKDGENTRRMRWGEQFDSNMELLYEDARINAATGHSRVIQRMSINKTTPDAKRDVMEALLLPENSTYITMESLLQIIQFSAIRYVPDIHCPVFLAQGAEDVIVLPSEAKEIYDTLPKETHKKLKIYEGIDHNMAIHEKRMEVFGDIAQWFMNTL